jgi:thiol:disulfide interchange protein DsbC
MIEATMIEAKTHMHTNPENTMPIASRLPFRAISLLLALASGMASADEASVRREVEKYVGVPVVESVSRLPHGGLYEVVLNSGELIYTDDAVSFIIDGRIIDTKTRRDITRARLEKLATIDFKSLPLEQAVKRTNGNGKRVVVTFEDPNCGYCKVLGQELEKVKDITIYTFLYPILSEDSATKSRDIWCAKDKAAAWLDWIVKDKTPKTAECDIAAIERNMLLGRKLRITGTPTLFFADGSRIGGYRDAAGIEETLAAIAGAAGKAAADAPAVAVDTDKPASK